ncbi:prolyl oligopeptidase family serine peptidase [Lichenicola sp.]|uniref:alpha/beta hydrolase family protein n=1 Tax=Lichenicola sp. TaxID=2804529 RepID=UPI003AFF9AB1
MRATRIAAPLGAILIASPLAAVGAAVAAIAAPTTPPQHLFTQVAMSPDGAHVASLEADLPADENAEPTFRIVIRSVSGEGQPVTVGLPCKGAECVPSSLAWSMDSHRLAFVLQQPDPHKTDHRRRVYAVDASGAGLSQLLAFDGTLEGLRYGPGGTLAVLATAGAHKEPGATQAAAKMTGEIGESEDEQRIGTIADGALHYQSPADLYVYEYDWQPDQAQPDHARFVGTAAHGNGDNNWWVAKLYGFDGGAARVLYSPPQRQQLADPVVSPDGTSVAFIGGIMSDFGSTGGDVFRLALDQVGTGGSAAPVAASVLQNLTPNLRASVTALSWACGGGLTATALAGSKAELMTLGGGAEHVIWSGEETLSASRGGDGIACGGGNSAAIHQNFTTAPEIEAGPIGQWHALTHANASQHVPVSVRSVEWRNDGSDVQGWLLSPGAGMPAGAMPPGAMIVSVHGGPSAASTPIYLSQRGLTLFLLQAGYRVFLPNPRGSFGQGETFTQANVRDFGHGDLRDILTGIDAVERIAPVDDHRLGLTGYSYGGYMTMWTVTQTNRFAAAVAGAGVSDWESYYGENGIDEWMLPFFGASVYDDPLIYAKSSPITYIRQVHTPTFEFVGDADVECPMPQTQEFYHALHTLGVPTEFVVYAGQGHGMRDPADLADARRRMLAWFAKYLTPKTSKG